MDLIPRGANCPSFFCSSSFCSFVFLEWWWIVLYVQPSLALSLNLHRSLVSSCRTPFALDFQAKTPFWPLFNDRPCVRWLYFSRGKIFRLPGVKSCNCGTGTWVLKSNWSVRAIILFVCVTLDRQREENVFRLVGLISLCFFVSGSSLSTLVAVRSACDVRDWIYTCSQPVWTDTLVDAQSLQQHLKGALFSEIAFSLFLLERGLTCCCERAASGFSRWLSYLPTARDTFKVSSPHASFLQ